MRVSLIKPIVLCIALGPLGLLAYHWQYALIATLLTVVCALRYSEFAFYIWLLATVLSTVTAITILRSNLQRQRIDSFRLSNYKGTVSYRESTLGPYDRSQNTSYEPLLRKYRRRHRRRLAINTTLAALCLFMVYLIADPHRTFSVINTEDSKHNAKINNNSIDPPQQEVSLLESNQQGRFTLRSSNLLSGKNGHYRAELHIHCNNNRTSLALHTADILGTERSLISLYTNNKLFHSSAWQINSDYHTANAPSPVKTLRKVNNLSELVVQYHPFDSDKKSNAHFDAALINTAVLVVRKACHW